MCHADQKCCAEMIVKEGFCYIVDDYQNLAIMKYSEFENLIKIYTKKVKL